MVAARLGAVNAHKQPSFLDENRIKETKLKPHNRRQPGRSAGNELGGAAEHLELGLRTGCSLLPFSFLVVRPLSIRLPVCRTPGRNIETGRLQRFHLDETLLRSWFRYQIYRGTGCLAVSPA